MNYNLHGICLIITTLISLFLFLLAKYLKKKNWVQSTHYTSIEFLRKDSIIKHPSNAWSSLGYIYFGFCMIIDINSYSVKAYSIYMILMGVVSYLFHANRFSILRFFDLNLIFSLK